MPRTAFALAVVLGCFLGSVLSATEPVKLTIGQPVPAWHSLPGVDGRQHSLADLRESEVVVVAITCNHCPIAIEYHDRMKEFVAQRGAPGGKVTLVAISVSDLETDGLARMEQMADRQQLNFAYLIDESQQVARDFGATNTPQFFVLDAQRRLAYRGAWDDNLNATKVKSRHVEQAVDSLLAGQTPLVKETKPSGCPINYK